MSDDVTPTRFDLRRNLRTSGAIVAELGAVFVRAVMDTLGNTEVTHVLPPQS